MFGGGDDELARLQPGVALDMLSEVLRFLDPVSYMTMRRVSHHWRALTQQLGMHGRRPVLRLHYWCSPCGNMEATHLCTAYPRDCVGATNVVPLGGMGYAQQIDVAHCDFTVDMHSDQSIGIALRDPLCFQDTVSSGVTVYETYNLVVRGTRLLYERIDGVLQDTTVAHAAVVWCVDDTQ